MPNLPGTDTSRPTLRGERAPPIPERGGRGCHSPYPYVTKGALLCGNGGTKIFTDRAPIHHDRALPYIRERKRDERVCDGNNAPPENPPKKPDMKRVPFKFESVPDQ